MIELFIGLYHIVIAASLGRWFYDVNAGKIPPICVSITYLFFAVGCTLGFYVSTTVTQKMFYTGLGCNMLLISFVYQITNDHEEYHKEAGVWIAILTRCFMVTAIFTLAMDLSNTMVLLRAYILGIASACIPLFFMKGQSERRE